MTQLFIKYRNGQHRHEEFSEGELTEHICEVERGQKGSQATWTPKNQSSKRYALAFADNKAVWVRPPDPNELCRWNVGSATVSGEAEWGGAGKPISETRVSWNGSTDAESSVPPTQTAVYNGPIGVLVVSPQSLMGPIPTDTSGVWTLSNGSLTITGTMILTSVDSILGTYLDLAIGTTAEMQAVFGSGFVPDFANPWILIKSNTSGFVYNATPIDGTFPASPQYGPENDTFRLALVDNPAGEREITGVYTQDGSNRFYLGSEAEMVAVFGEDPINSGDGQFILYEATPLPLTATFSGAQGVNIQRGQQTTIGGIVVAGGRPPYVVAATNSVVSPSLTGSGNIRTLSVNPADSAVVGAQTIRVDVSDSTEGTAQAVVVDVNVNIVGGEALTITCPSTIPANIAAGQTYNLGNVVGAGGTGNITFVATSTYGTVALSGERGNRTVMWTAPSGENPPETATISITATDSGTPAQTATCTVVIPLGDVFNAGSTVQNPSAVAIGAVGEPLGVIVPIGGVSPYIYTSDITGVSFNDSGGVFFNAGANVAGTSLTGNLTVADTAGSSKSFPLVINIVSSLTLTTTISDPVDVVRGSLAQLGFVTVEGGSDPYTFSSEDEYTTIEGPAGPSAIIIFNSPVTLTVGLRPVLIRVVDSTGAIGGIVLNLNITEQSELAVEFNPINDSAVNVIQNRFVALGSIVVTGGTGPFTYVSSDTNFQFTDNAIGYQAPDNDPAGMKSTTVTATDSTNATATVNISNAVNVIERLRLVSTVPNPASVVTSNSIEGDFVVLGVHYGNLGTITATGGINNPGGDKYRGNVVSLQKVSYSVPFFGAGIAAEGFPDGVTSVIPSINSFNSFISVIHTIRNTVLGPASSGTSVARFRVSNGSGDDGTYQEEFINITTNVTQVAGASIRFTSAANTPISVSVGSTVTLGTVEIVGNQQPFTFSSSTAGIAFTGSGNTQTVTYTPPTGTSAGVISPQIEAVNPPNPVIATVTLTNAANVTTS